MHYSANARLALHNHVGYPHLATQGREEDDELDRVDIMRDDDKLGFLRLDKRDDVVQPILGEQRFLGVLETYVEVRI